MPANNITSLRGCAAAVAISAFLVLLPVSCKKHRQPLPDKDDQEITQGGETVDKSDVVIPDEEFGIGYLPESLNADKPCTIYFYPSASSKISSSLYNIKGDLYAHLGVYYDEEWKYVVAKWNENTPKCKMTRMADNAYKLEIKPSIREFFNSGKTPVEGIAIVIRNAYGTKQTTKDLVLPVTDNLYQGKIFVPEEITNEAMPAGLKHGINYGSDNSVTFVLYDRSKISKTHHDYVCLIGEFNDWERSTDYQMKWDETAGCWWYTLTGMDPDREYMFQYYVGDGDKGFRIFDATSEIVYDPWNDQYISSATYPDLPDYPSATKGFVGAFRINRPSYAWQVPNYTISNPDNLIIYELLFRDFSTTRDIPGALQKLDYIKDLGVTAVELMPIQEFDGNQSWGYNPCSYFALDKAYGTREMYKQFIDECHKKGMAVIVDVVYNHTTGSHPFAMLWWNGEVYGTEENPYYNMVSPSSYSYFHDINHQVPEMVSHIKESLKFLMEEYHIDGFRFDFTKGFTNTVGADETYDRERIEVLWNYNNFIKDVNPNAMVILEHLLDSENSDLSNSDKGMYLWNNQNKPFTNIVKGWNADIGGIYDPYSKRVGYIESHDEPRVCFGSTVWTSDVSWGICGSITKWGDATTGTADIKLKPENGLYVARDVVFTSTDEFKIRGDNSWNVNDRNFGAYTSGDKISAGTDGYVMKTGSDSGNLMAPAAGTYDVWFSPELTTVWIVAAGSAQPRENVHLEIAMRRAGLAAAFSMLVPGPKMIWQFGELGCDIAGGNGDTSTKDPVWDYYNIPARKRLHDTYASLFAFRKANPAFFTPGTNFRLYVGEGDYEYGKFMFAEADGKTFGVMGNFLPYAKDITITLPHGGNWYDYTTGNAVSLHDGNYYTEYLQTGEFRVLVDFK